MLSINRETPRYFTAAIKESDPDEYSSGGAACVAVFTMRSSDQEKVSPWKGPIYGPGPKASTLEVNVSAFVCDGVRSRARLITGLNVRMYFFQTAAFATGSPAGP